MRTPGRIMSGQRLTLRNGAVSIKTRKWPVVAAAQATGKLALTPKTFAMEAEAWSPYAFCDRNSFAEKKCSRPIFVVISGDGNAAHVLLFHEDGTIVDEPEEFTPGGKQMLEIPNSCCGFLSEWEQGYYELCTSAMTQQDSLEEPVPEETEKQETEKTTEETTEETAGAETEKQETEKTTAETIAAEGKRVAMLFGTGWYTGLVIKVGSDNGDRTIAFDDYEFKVIDAATLQNCLDSDGGPTLKAADPADLGIKNNEAGHLMVERCLSFGGCLVGSLVGATDETLGGEPIYQAFIVRAGAFEQAPKRARTARVKEESKSAQQDRLGYHTFRRGDLVQFKGLQADERDVLATVYGVVQQGKEGSTTGVNQEDKMLVLKCATTDVFFLGTWPKWQRVPCQGLSGVLDLDDSKNVQCISGEECEKLVNDFQASSELSHLSLSQARSRSHKEPPSLGPLRAEKRRRDRAEKKKQEAAAAKAAKEKEKARREREAATVVDAEAESEVDDDNDDAEVLPPKHTPPKSNRRNNGGGGGGGGGAGGKRTRTAGSGRECDDLSPGVQLHGSRRSPRQPPGPATPPESGPADAEASATRHAQGAAPA